MASNTHDIKNRIKSINETLKITKAMKLISGVKLKKARTQLDNTMPYFQKVMLTLTDILSHTESFEHVCLQGKDSDVENQPVGKKAYIIITGDKGMVGSYNTNLIKFAEQHISTSSDDVFYVAGNVGRSYFNKHGYSIDQEFYYNVLNPTVLRARDIADKIFDEFLADKYDEVYMIYTHMVNSLNLQPRIMKLLPLDLNSLYTSAADIDLEQYASQSDRTSQLFQHQEEHFLYRPNPVSVFDSLVPKYLKGIIYGGMVESFTCEQSARMTAMDQATENAEEMIAKLQLHYNRARQAQITQEITEIIGGASALNG